MNERLQELAEQSYVDADAGDGVYQRFSMEKFALLIVQECAQLAMTEHHSTSPADYGDLEPYEQGCDDTASAISGKIRRIFGVDKA